MGIERERERERGERGRGEGRGVRGKWRGVRYVEDSMRG